MARSRAHCDVVLENFRPGLLASGVSATTTLAAANPGVVLVHVSRFRADRSARARTRASARSARRWAGIRHTTGDPDRPPARAGVSLGDALAALFAVIGTLAAITERERSGRGQEVDVAIYEAVLALMESTVADWELGGRSCAGAAAACCRASRRRTRTRPPTGTTW